MFRALTAGVPSGELDVLFPVLADGLAAKGWTQAQRAAAPTAADQLRQDIRIAREMADGFLRDQSLKCHPDGIAALRALARRLMEAGVTPVEDKPRYGYDHGSPTEDGAELWRQHLESASAAVPPPPAPPERWAGIPRLSPEDNLAFFASSLGANLRAERGEPDIPRLSACCGGLGPSGGRRQNARSRSVSGRTVQRREVGARPHQPDDPGERAALSALPLPPEALSTVLAGALAGRGGAAAKGAGPEDAPSIRPAALGAGVPLMDRRQLAATLAAAIEAEDPVLAKLEAIEQRLVELAAQAAAPPGTRLLSVKQFAQQHPAFAISTLRHYIADRERNGLADAIVAFEGKVAIDENRMLELLREASKIRTAGSQRTRRGRPRRAA